MRPSGVTERQARILSFIHRYVASYGLSPSFEEIASQFGTTAPSVSSTIKGLERRGLLSRMPGVARSLRVLVPESALQGSDFGCGKAGGGRRISPPASVSPSDAAVAAALAVIEVLMKRIEAGGDRSVLVVRSAEAVRASLKEAGLGEGEATEAARRVAAEAARWEPGGRGIAVRRRVWTRARPEE